MKYSQLSFLMFFFENFEKKISKNRFKWHLTAEFGDEAKHGFRNFVFFKRML